MNKKRWLIILGVAVFFIAITIGDLAYTIRKVSATMPTNSIEIEVTATPDYTE